MIGIKRRRGILCVFLCTENHSLGEWFRRRLLQMMQKEKCPSKAVKNKDNGKGANSIKTVKREKEWLGKKESK